MTVPFWPEDLPCRLQRDGYSESVRDGRLRQAMDAGPAKVRRRSSAAVRPVSGTIIVGFDGRARFERFWDEETGGGVLPFWIRDHLHDGIGLSAADGVPLLTGDDAPIIIESWWLARFGEAAPAISRISPQKWSISISLDILP